MNEIALNAVLFKGFFVAGKLKSPRIGEFPFYPDFRILFSRIEKLEIIGEELAKNILPLKPDLIASREAAGVPFGVATALRGKVNFLYLRKEPKGYNTNNMIEGLYEPGQTVMVVDDAVSTGGDKKKIVETLEQAGLKVLGIAVVMDSFYGQQYRQDQEWLRRNDPYHFISLFTWPELMDYAADQKFFGRELCQVVKEWLNNPLIWQTKEENWQKFKALALKEKNLNFHPSFKTI